MAFDPVCKLNVDEKETIFISEYKDKKYYFYSQLCKLGFDENPDQFIK